jgi:hypothetical protein
MTTIRRLLAVEAVMQERAESATTLADSGITDTDGQFTAALRGKARGYREAAELLHAELAPTLAQHEQDQRAAQ